MFVIEERRTVVKWRGWNKGWESDSAKVAASLGSITCGKALTKGLMSEMGWEEVLFFVGLPDIPGGWNVG